MDPLSLIEKPKSQFFKPTIGKFVLLILLAIVFSWLIKWTLPVAEFDKLKIFEGKAYWVGFPFPYLIVYIYTSLPWYLSLAFVGDLVLWYIVSCFLVWILDKFKKKPTI